MSLFSKTQLIVPVVCSLCLIGCGTTEDENMTANDLKAPSPEDRVAVEEAINNVFGWAVNKDFGLFFGTVANDTDFISVTPYKRVKLGFEEVRKDSAFWGSPDFKAIRHELRDLKIVFSHGGDVAWFFCYLDDINEWKGEPANWENARWTGVLEKRDGKWRVVQQHFSFPQ
jgi:ketosteroid isomerase-like protein